MFPYYPEEYKFVIKYEGDDKGLDSASSWGMSNLIPLKSQ